MGTVPFLYMMYSRACLKNHSCNLHAPLCGRFHPNSVAVARYGALIREKSPTNCDAHLAESLFQTRSRSQPPTKPQTRQHPLPRRPSAQKKETLPLQCLPSGIVYSFLIYISVKIFSLSGFSPLNSSRNKIITGSYPCILASCPIRK